MGGFWTDQFSFRTGAVRLPDLGYLLAGSDEEDEEDVEHTAVLTWDDGEWWQHPLEWSAISACICKVPKDQLVAIAGAGEFLVFGQGEILEGSIYGGKQPDDKAGPFRSVNRIAGKAYAVGMDRLVFRRDENGNWARMDRGLSPGGNLEAIHGFGEDEVYAVGWNGEMWHYNGKSWSQINSPTNLILTGVCCAPDGNVYCCGRAGTLIRGRGDDWEVIDHQDTEADFWDVEWFDGKLYLSTILLVYTLEDDALRAADFGDDEPDTCCHLSSADGVLWSIGQKDVLAFDGKHWTRID